MKDLIRKILLEYEIPNPIPGNKTVTSGYGNRTHPTTREQKMHYGIDIAVNCNVELKAPLDGTVKEVGQSNDGCGGSITIEHNGFRTRYCHLSTIKVNKFEKVFAGEVIGKTGGKKGEEGSGSSTGCHLHFEVKDLNGGYLNPSDHINLDIAPRRTEGGTIKLNDNNEQIKTFKCFLKHSGYDKNIDDSNLFDTKTVDAVKKLQNDLNINPTGTITPDMIPLIKDKIQSLSSRIRRDIESCYSS